MSRYLMAMIGLTFIFLIGYLSRHYYWLDPEVIRQLFYEQSESHTQIDYKHTAHYKERVSLFEVLDNTRAEVVFVGDSITESGSWQEFFLERKVVNRGIADDTTFGLKERLNSIMSTSARKVFIMIGINDFRHEFKVKEAFSNYIEITEELLTIHRDVYIQSTLLTNQLERRSLELNKQVILLNSKLRQYAEKKERVHFIDINKLLQKDLQLNEKYTFDGIHLSGEAYSKWAEYIRNLLN